MAQSLEKNIKFQETARNAGDQEITEKFLEQAEKEGWSFTDMAMKLNKVEGLSRVGRSKLAKQIAEGSVNKETPINRAEADRLKVMIDDRRKGLVKGGPMSFEEVGAEIQRAGLTLEQSKAVKDYLSKGGMLGQEGLAGKVADLVREMLNEKKEYVVPPGFIEIVAGDLPSGRQATPDELRLAVSRRLISKFQGETSGTGWWWDTDESYKEAGKLQRGKNWLPDVDSDEKEEIDLALQAVGVEVNDYHRRLWKKAEVQGLPLSKEEENELKGSR